VVLDEAHSIKDRRCSTARAVFALNSKYKWALSGTPLQVRLSLSLSMISPVPYHFWHLNCGLVSEGEWLLTADLQGNVISYSRRGAVWPSAATLFIWTGNAFQNVAV
jgi:hypothetical protein